MIPTSRRHPEGLSAVALVALMLVHCSSERLPPPAKSPVVDALFSPPAVRLPVESEPTAEMIATLSRFLASPDLDALRSPDRVETLPIEELSESAAKKGVHRIKTSLPGFFGIVPEPRPVAAEIAAEFSAVVLDPASYLPGYKGCVFSPGITFRFWKGERAVDVFVCFHCRDLAFQSVGAPQALGGKLSFDPTVATLARLAARARPGDARFAHLAEVDAVP